MARITDRRPIVVALRREKMGVLNGCGGMDLLVSVFFVSNLSRIASKT